MNKRITFISLNVISILITLCLVIIFKPTIFGILAYTFVYVIISLLLTASMNITNHIMTGNDTKRIFTHKHFLFGGLTTIGYKKIHSSKYGYYYVSVDKGGLAYIYKQGIFILEFITTRELYKNDSTEDIITSLNSALELYHNNLNRNTLKSRFSKWDGYLDKSAEREGKIDQLVG